MQNNYSMYLFAMLWHVTHPEHNKLEYDLSFEKIIVDFEEFKDSPFDDPKVSLYDCIIEFFNAKKRSEE